jgi:hypothetical protein
MECWVCGRICDLRSFGPHGTYLNIMKIVLKCNFSTAMERSIDEIRRIIFGLADASLMRIAHLF